MPEFLAYLSSPFVIRAAAAVFFVAVNAAFSGAFAGFRNSTFLISGASHAALAGAALVIVLETHAMALGLNPLVGGALFAVALALVAGNASNRGVEADVDTAIGVGFSAAMALAVLFISLVPESATRVWGLLLGDLMLITTSELRMLALMTLLVVAAFALFRRQFLFITFDIEGARAFGIPVERYNYLLFALIGLSSAILVKGIGAILVFAMLSAPAATALVVAGSVARTMWLSFWIALAAGFSGIVASYFSAFSASALTAFFATLSYFVVRAWKWAGSRRSAGR